MVCDPTVDVAHFSSKIARLDVGLVGGTTDLAAGLVLAGKFPDLAVVVIVTDGQTNSNGAALDAAARLKSRGVDIICIGGWPGLSRSVRRPGIVQCSQTESRPTSSLIPCLGV